MTIPPGFDEPIIMPEFIDDPNSNAPPVFPPGISITNAAVDKLLALDLCAETSAAASMNKVHTAFKSVLINDLVKIKQILSNNAYFRKKKSSHKKRQKKRKAKSLKQLLKKSI